MKILFLSMTAAFAFLFASGSRPAAAQDNGTKNYCISESTDNGGNVVLGNTCDVQLHVYWVRNSRPGITYNNYISPGGRITAYMEGSGSYTVYACDAAYYVVDDTGRVITHYVNSFACRAK